MTKRRSIRLLLEFDAPAGVPFSDIRDFITTALEADGGSRHPNDPLFESLANVRVSKPITAWREPTKHYKPPDWPAANAALPANNRDGVKVAEPEPADKGFATKPPVVKLVRSGP